MSIVIVEDIVCTIYKFLLGHLMLNTCSHRLFTSSITEHCTGEAHRLLGYYCYD